MLHSQVLEGRDRKVKARSKSQQQQQQQHNRHHPCLPAVLLQHGMMSVLVCSITLLFTMRLLRFSYWMEIHKFVCCCVQLFTAAAESLIVLKGVGVLLVSRQRWGGSSSRFLDGQDIHSVFMHEVGREQQQQHQQQQLFGWQRH
jgi:hypothetical protein